MRIAVCTVLLGLVNPVFAVDLRGVQLGQSCRHAAEVELSLGTEPRSDVGSMLDLGILAFEDQSIAGRHTQYLYRCTQPENLVSHYSITVKTRSEAQAWAIYAEAKAAVASRLGTPQYDSNSPEEVEKLRVLRLKGLFGFYAVANWSSEKHQGVSLGLERDPESGEWSVSTSVFEITGESPNTSLERTRER